MLNSVVFGKRESDEYLLQTFHELHESHTPTLKLDDTTAIVPYVINMTIIAINLKIITNIIHIAMWLGRGGVTP